MYLQCGWCRAMLTTGDRQSGESCVCTGRRGRRSREHQIGGGEGAPLVGGARYYIKDQFQKVFPGRLHFVTARQCHEHQGKKMALIRLFESFVKFCSREGRRWGECSNPWRGGGARVGEASKTQSFHGGAVPKISCQFDQVEPPE